MVIVNADDRSRASGVVSRRGRPLNEALALLVSAPLPDEAFGHDLEAVIAAVGAIPSDPRERS